MNWLSGYWPECGLIFVHHWLIFCVSDTSAIEVSNYAIQLNRLLCCFIAWNLLRMILRAWWMSLVIWCLQGVTDVPGRYLVHSGDLVELDAESCGHIQRVHIFLLNDNLLVASLLPHRSACELSQSVSQLMMIGWPVRWAISWVLCYLGRCTFKGSVRWTNGRSVMQSVIV